MPSLSSEQRAQLDGILREVVAPEAMQVDTAAAFPAAAVSALAAANSRFLASPERSGGKFTSGLFL